MTHRAVDFYVKDTTPSKNPVSGVLVKVLSQDGRVVFGEATTDALGHAGFLLPPGFTFQGRFFKQNVGFTNPQLFVVADDDVSNIFDVPASLITPPTSLDSRLCIAYGYFRRPDGSPAASTDLHFINKFKPLWLEGAGVLSERVVTRTDAKGYVQVSLIRNGKYDVVVSGLEEMQRCISVPDASNVNLPDLLFPVVKKVTLTPAGPYTIAVGQDLVLQVALEASDGNALEKTALDDVVYSSSDTAVLGVLPTTENVTLRGIAPGTAQLIVKRLDNSIVRIPDPGISGQPVVVTVTP